MSSNERQLLRKAIQYAEELLDQGWSCDEEEIHEVLLNRLGITQSEYDVIMNVK